MVRQAFADCRKGMFRMKQNDSILGMVFGIQRFSIHDGPGIRTTVFLKGCNLSCKWCHNPEGLSKKVQIGLNREKCVLCGACSTVCPNGCHSLRENKHIFDRKSCSTCGKCVKVCFEKALEQIGKYMTVDEVMQVLLRDRKYYVPDGGITLSGGEAMLHREFALALLKRCKKEGIHCALETNGVHSFEEYIEFLPLVDLFLLDYKATDAQIHREYVGCDNRIVLENMHRLHDAGAKLLMRCPIIPGVNDNAVHFNAIARLTQELPYMLGAEILPYHNLGVAKANRIAAYYEEFAAPSIERIEQWKQYIRTQGGRLVNAE